MANIDLRDNNIIINKMNHPSCVTSFIRCVNKAIKRKIHNINIHCDCEKESIFPDACLPISALIKNYTKFYNVSFNLKIPKDSYLKKCFFGEHLFLLPEELNKIKNPFDKILTFSSKEGYEGQIAQITQTFIDYMSKDTVCEEGVIKSLIWCINEVMDNVLVHSGENTGYIMAQYHRKKNRLAFCVCDYGIGIHKTLLESKHKPATEIDALTMAIQEGIGDGKGQGNGLYGLYQIVKENGGKLTISSGESAIMLSNSKGLQKFDNCEKLIRTNPGTIVDFQLDISKKIDIQTALCKINGFDGFDIRIDNMWDDNNSNWLRYNVYENCSGTGTRLAGKELKNDVINTLRRTKAPIILDFEAVKTCSSSFIDEFLCKLFLELGVLEFNKLIKIENMDDFIKHLFERSIYMRMHTEWENVSDKK